MNNALFVPLDHLLTSIPTATAATAEPRRSASRIVKANRR